MFQTRTGCPCPKSVIPGIRIAVRHKVNRLDQRSSAVGEAGTLASRRLLARDGFEDRQQNHPAPSSIRVCRRNFR